MDSINIMVFDESAPDICTNLDKEEGIFTQV